MGNTCVAESSADGKDKGELLFTKAFDDQMITERREAEKIQKLLLLGPGESGKSTLFKQAISLYKAPFTEKDLVDYTLPIWRNIFDSMQTLIKQAPILAAQKGDPSFQIDESLKDECECIMAVDPAGRFPDEASEAIAKLWSDKGVKKTFEHRSSFQLQDTCDYFFKDVERVLSENYLPTENDILYTRIRTTGIKETQFCIEKGQFTLVDVGGQRSERRKWIHSFDQVSGVIFVAAISEYDQLVWEDQSTHRILESVDLFDEICNSKWFKDAAMILFLNKRDLLEEKLKKTPLPEDIFADFEGDRNNYDDVSLYLKRMFENRNQNNKKAIYTHITCATDRNNVKHVFHAVKDAMMRVALREAFL